MSEIRLDGLRVGFVMCRAGPPKTRGKTLQTSLIYDDTRTFDLDEDVLCSSP